MGLLFMGLLMKKLIITACLLSTPAVAAQPPSYEECRQIVATHSFMMEMKKECQLRLRSDTSDLAYTCTASLNKFHRDLAVRYGKDMSTKYRAEYKKSACNHVEEDFTPLLQE